jgi:hypothetical protein
VGAAMGHNYSQQRPGTANGVRDGILAAQTTTVHMVRMGSFTETEHLEIQHFTRVFTHFCKGQIGIIANSVFRFYLDTVKKEPLQLDM